MSQANVAQQFVQKLPVFRLDSDSHDDRRILHTFSSQLDEIAYHQLNSMRQSGTIKFKDGSIVRYAKVFGLIMTKTLD